MARHQGSSPTGVFSAVKQLVKGTELIAHRMTLMENELRTLRQANQALAKRRRAKKTRVRAGGALSIGDAQVLIDERDASTQQSGGRSAKGGTEEARPATQWHCRGCSKTGHNVRTC